MKKFILFIICVCIYACTSQKPIVQTVEVVKTEREIVRDTVVQIEPDSAMVRAWLECDSTNTVILKRLDTQAGERLKPTAKRYTTSGGMVLQVECKEDSFKYELQVRDKIIEQMKTETTIVKVRERNGYDRFTSWGFWILALLLFARIAWWAFKTFYLHKA